MDSNISDLIDNFLKPLTIEESSNEFILYLQLFQKHNI